MKKYQIFAASSVLFMLANNWHLVSYNSLFPRLFDYVAYGFFIFGIFKLSEKKDKD